MWYTIHIFNKKEHNNMAKKNADSVVDIHNRITPLELESLIKTTYLSFHGENRNEDACSASIKSMPIMIHSSPGCGKSSVVRKCAEDLGIGFIDVRLCQIEPCDIKGLPVPNKEEHTMDWFVNGMWPRDPNSKGILFLDELSAADRSIAVAAYELILDRRLGKLYSLPDGWMIVGAGNMAGDRAVAAPMSSALANRFLHVELDPDWESWLEWGLVHHIHPSVMGYIRFRPDALFTMDGQTLDRGWPSPRSWERVSQMCYVIKDDSVLSKVVYGLIGQSVGVEFMEFKKMSAEFDNILEIMTNPSKKIVIPKEADRKNAMVSAMIYHLWRGKDEEEEAKRLDGFFRICIELDPAFSAMAVQAGYAGNDRVTRLYASKKMYNCPLRKKWAAKQGKNINSKYEIDITDTTC